MQSFNRRQKKLEEGFKTEKVALRKRQRQIHATGQHLDPATIAAAISKTIPKQAPSRLPSGLGLPAVYFPHPKPVEDKRDDAEQNSDPAKAAQAVLEAAPKMTLWDLPPRLSLLAMSLGLSKPKPVEPPLTLDEQAILFGKNHEQSIAKGEAIARELLEKMRADEEERKKAKEACSVEMLRIQKELQLIGSGQPQESKKRAREESEAKAETGPAKKKRKKKRAPQCLFSEPVVSSVVSPAASSSEPAPASLSIPLGGLRKER